MTEVSMPRKPILEQKSDIYLEKKSVKMHKQERIEFGIDRD